MVNWSDYKSKNSCNISDWNIFENQSLTDEKLDSDLNFRNRPTDSTLPHYQHSFYSQKEQSCLVSHSFQKQNALWVNRSTTKESPSCEGIACLTSNIVIPGDIPISSLFGYASAIGPILFYSEKVRSYLRPTRTGSEQRHVFRIHGKFPNQSEFSAEVDTDDTGKKMEAVPKKDQVEESFYYDAGRDQKFRQGHNYLLRRVEGPVADFRWEFGNPKFFLEFSLNLNASKTDLLLRNSSLTLDARGSSDGIKHFAGNSSFKGPLSIVHTRTVTSQDPLRGEVKVDLHILSDGSVAKIYSIQRPQPGEVQTSEFWRPRAGKIGSLEEGLEKMALVPERDANFGIVYRSATSPYAFAYSDGNVDLIPAAIHPNVGDSTYIPLNRLGVVKPSQMVLVPTDRQLARLMLNPPAVGEVIEVDLQGEIQNGSNSFTISSDTPLKVQGRFEGSGKERKFVPDLGQRLAVLIYDATTHRPLPGLLEMEVTAGRQGQSFVGFDYSSRPTEPTVSFKAPFTNAEIGSVGVGSLERVNPRVAENWERLKERREGELIPSLSGVSGNEGRITFNVGRRLLTLYLRYSPQSQTYSDPEAWLQDWRYHLASPLELHRAGLDVLSGDMVDPETGVVKRVQMIPTEASWFLRVEGEGIIYRVKSDIVTNDLSSIQLYDTSPDLAGRMLGEFPEFPSLPPPSKPDSEASAAEKKGEASPSSVIPDLKVTDIQLASPEEDPRSTDVALRVTLSDGSWVELHILRKSSESRAVSPRISGLNGFLHSSSGRAEISVELLPATRDQREAILVHPQTGVDVLIPRPLTTKILSRKLLTLEDLQSIQIRGAASPEVSASMEAAGSPAEDLVCEVPSPPPPTLDLSPLSVPVLPASIDDLPRIPTREEEGGAITEFREDILRALRQGNVPEGVTARVGRDLERRTGEPLWNWQVRVHKALVDFAREESGIYNGVYNRLVTRVRRHWEFAGEPKRGSRMYIPAVDDLGAPQGRVLVLADEEPATASVEAGVGADSRVCEPADANASAAPAALEVSTVVTPTGAAQEVGTQNEGSPSALVCLPEENARVSAAIDLRVTDLKHAADLKFPTDPKSPEVIDFAYKVFLSDGSWVELHISRKSTEKRSVSPRIAGLSGFLHSSSGRAEVSVELVPGSRDQREAILIHPRAGVDVLIPRPLTTKALGGKTITEEDLQSIQVRGVVADSPPSADAQTASEALALVAAAGEVIPAQFVPPVAQQIRVKEVQVKEIDKKEGEYTDYRIKLILTDEARIEIWKLKVRVFQDDKKEMEILDSYFEELGKHEKLKLETEGEWNTRRMILTQERSALSAELNPAELIQKFREKEEETSPDFLKMIQLRGQEAYEQSHTLKVPAFIENGGFKIGDSSIEVDFRMIEAKKLEDGSTQRTFEMIFPDGRRIVTSGVMRKSADEETYLDISSCYLIPPAASGLPPQDLTSLVTLDSVPARSSFKKVFFTVIPLGRGESFRINYYAFLTAIRKDTTQREVNQARSRWFVLRQENLPSSPAEAEVVPEGAPPNLSGLSPPLPFSIENSEVRSIEISSEESSKILGEERRVVPITLYHIALKVWDGKEEVILKLEVEREERNGEREIRLLYGSYEGKGECGKVPVKGGLYRESPLLKYPGSPWKAVVHVGLLIDDWEKLGKRVDQNLIQRTVILRQADESLSSLIPPSRPFKIMAKALSSSNPLEFRMIGGNKTEEQGKLGKYRLTLPDGDFFELSGLVGKDESVTRGRLFQVDRAYYFTSADASPVEITDEIFIDSIPDMSDLPSAEGERKIHNIVVVPYRGKVIRLHSDSFAVVLSTTVSPRTFDTGRLITVRKEGDLRNLAISSREDLEQTETRQLPVIYHEITLRFKNGAVWRLQFKAFAHSSERLFLQSATFEDGESCKELTKHWNAEELLLEDPTTNVKVQFVPNELFAGWKGNGRLSSSSLLRYFSVWIPERNEISLSALEPSQARVAEGGVCLEAPPADVGQEVLESSAEVSPPVSTQPTSDREESNRPEAEVCAPPSLPSRPRRVVDEGFLVTGGRGAVAASYVAPVRSAREVVSADDPMMLAGAASRARPPLPIGNDLNLSDELIHFSEEIGITNPRASNLGTRIYSALNEQVGGGYAQFIPLRDYLEIVYKATQGDLRIYRNDLLLHAVNQWVQVFNTSTQREILLENAADRAAQFIRTYQTRRAVQEEVREELGKLVRSIHDHLEKAKEEELRRRKDAEDKK